MELKDGPHPFSISLSEIRVDGNEMHAAAEKGVQIHRRHGHEGLTLAGLHLGDAALVQYNPTKELNVVRHHVPFDGAATRRPFLPDHAAAGLRSEERRVGNA